jgi:hypothetical protein
MSDRIYNDIIARGRGDLIDKTAYPLYLDAGEETPYTGTKSQHMFYHFAAWLAGTEIVDFMLCAQIGAAPIINTREQNTLVVFGKRQDRDAFLAWRKRVSSWFVNEPFNEEYMPSLPLEGSRMIHMVEAKIEQNDFAHYYTDELFELWSWITHNCTNGAVWRVQNGFAFESETDAVHFKLRKRV